MHSPFVTFELQADATSFYITCPFDPIQNFTILQKKKLGSFGLSGYFSASYATTHPSLEHILGII